MFSISYNLLLILYVLLSTVSDLTVYVVNSKETNNNVSENKSDNSSKSNDNKEQLKDDDVIKNMIRDSFDLTA